MGTRGLLLMVGPRQLIVLNGCESIRSELLL
jgi:hypothetical protein